MTEVAQTFTAEQEIEILRRTVWSKQDWLNKFSDGRNKRPDHEIDRYREDLAFFRRLHDDCLALQGREG